MSFPGGLKTIIELLVISLVGFTNSLNGADVLLFEGFFLSWGSFHPVGGASGFSEASFQFWFVFFSHSGEEPGVEALGGSSLGSWALAFLLVSWGNSLGEVEFPSNVWGESLREVDVFLNSHLGVGVNNLLDEEISVFNLEFLVDFSPFTHGGSSFIESFGVPSDVGDDWDLSEISERHYEMFLLFIIY